VLPGFGDTKRHADRCGDGRKKMNETAPEADAEKSLLHSAESMTSSLPQKSIAELPWIPGLGSMSLVVRREKHKVGQALCYT
jgi:hypothetical protein